MKKQQVLGVREQVLEASNLFSHFPELLAKMADSIERGKLTSDDGAILELLKEICDQIDLANRSIKKL